MNAGIVALLALVVLVGGTVMGIASMLVLPLFGILVLIALAVWFAARKAEDKPPIK